MVVRFCAPLWQGQGAASVWPRCLGLPARYCVCRVSRNGQPFIVVRICSSLCHARGAISALPRGVAYACLPACACLLTRPRELVFRTRLAAQTDHMCPVYRWLALPPPLTPGMLAVLSCTPCPYFCAGLTR